MTSTKRQAFTMTLVFTSVKPVCLVESRGKNKGVDQHQCKSIYSSAAWQVFGLQHSKKQIWRLLDQSTESHSCTLMKWSG